MTPKIDFRYRAKTSLDSATRELALEDETRVRYAALDLRMAMEALTYDRLQAYAKEISFQALETWQPRDILKMLLEIDPTAESDSTVRVGTEGLLGEPPERMLLLGSEKVLNLKTLKKHYDALGSFLHMPTLRQLSKAPEEDLAGLKARCEFIRDFIASVLASPIRNITMGSFATMECVECGATLRRRFPHGANSVEVDCRECQASYRLFPEPMSSCRWEPLQQQISCPTEHCTHTFAIWQRDIKEGGHWCCPGCSTSYIIGLAFHRVSASD